MEKKATTKITEFPEDSPENMAKWVVDRLRTPKGMKLVSCCLEIEDVIIVQMRRVSTGTNVATITVDAYDVENNAVKVIQDIQDMLDAKEQRLLQPPPPTQQQPIRGSTGWSIGPILSEEYDREAFYRKGAEERQRAEQERSLKEMVRTEKERLDRVKERLAKQVTQTNPDVPVGVPVRRRFNLDLGKAKEDA